MGHWDRVFSLAPEQQEIVRAGHRTQRGVVHHLLVSKPFGHGSLAHPEGLFPDVIPCGVLPSDAFMKPDNVPGEVGKAPAVGPVLWHVDTVNRRASPRHGEPMKLLHHESVVLEEFLVVSAVGHVPFA
jgi:hypothetical protein